MKKTYWLAVLLLILAACSKMNAYKKFEQGKEIIYPSPFDSLKVYSGKNRVLISGQLSGDPNVTKYRIFWNGGADSLEGDIHPGGGTDTLHQLISGLPEGPISFVVRTYDQSGNISIPMNITGNVYGPQFQASLDLRGNRLVLQSMLELSGAASINWADADGLVRLAGMDIRYYDYSGGYHDSIVAALPTGQVTLLPGFDVSKAYQYQTLYMPDSTSIDTFSVVTLTAPLLTEVHLLNNVTPATNSSNDGSRWAILNSWTTTSGAENHNGYGGIDMRDNSIFFEGGYGAPAVSNGKIYQIAQLPPGTYTFDGSVNWWNNNGNNYIYVVAASGSGLPDVSTLSPAISYGQLTNGSDVQTQFSLTQATPVSVGLVMNMGDDGESIRFNSLRLYINH